MRGFCIGEASNLGPEGMYLYGDEDDEGDIDAMFNETILMATQVVQNLEEGDTEPPTPFGPTPPPPHLPAEVEFVPTPPSEVRTGGHFGTLAPSITGRIDIDVYEFRPFSGDDGDHIDCFSDAVVERLRKMPDVGALPTYVYVPKSLTRRYARQANLILKWWIKECDRRQPNVRHFEAANLFLLWFDFLLTRNNTGLEETRSTDHAKKEEVEPLKIIKSRLQKIEAGEWLVLIDDALLDIAKDGKRAESRRIEGIGDEFDGQEVHKLEAGVRKILGGDTRTGHRVMKSDGIHPAAQETVELMKRKFLISPGDSTMANRRDLKEKAKKIKCPAVLPNVLLKVISNTKDCKAAGCSG